MKFFLDSNITILLFTIVSGAFGLVFGSFCNVCIYRFPRGESILRPGSHCPHCGNSIAWYDNIPLISWVLLLGKCRHCRQPISIQYPIVELLTGILFIVIFLKFRLSIATIVYCLLSAGLMIVIVQDLKTWTIPDEVTLSGIILGVGVALLGMFFPEQGLRVTNPLDAIDGIALGGLIICLLDALVILMMKKPGMGFGDVKLLSMLGAFIGWQGVLGSLMVGSLLGSIVGFIIILYSKIARGKKVEQKNEERSIDQNDGYPIDPLASLIILISSLYLFIRSFIRLYLNYTFTLPREIIVGLFYILCGFFLFSSFISLVSLWIWRKQLNRGRLQNAQTEDEVEISLEEHYIPFGPYLSIGGLLYLIFGPELTTKYFQILSIE